MDLNIDLNKLDAIFLLLLAVSGNFVAETLNCSLQKHLTINMYFKSLVVFFMIYFTLNFVDKSQDQNPFEKLKQTFILWVMFLFLSRLDIFYGGVVLTLIVILYVAKNINDYYKNQEGIIKNNQKDIIKALNIITFIAIITTIYGAVNYYSRKKQEYGKKFKFMTFVFGVPQCKKITDLDLTNKLAKN